MHACSFIRGRIAIELRLVILLKLWITRALACGRHKYSAPLRNVGFDRTAGPDSLPSHPSTRFTNQFEYLFLAVKKHTKLYTVIWTYVDKRGLTAWYCSDHTKSVGGGCFGRNRTGEYIESWSKYILVIKWLLHLLFSLQGIRIWPKKMCGSATLPFIGLFQILKNC